MKLFTTNFIQKTTTEKRVFRKSNNGLQKFITIVKIKNAGYK